MSESERIGVGVGAVVFRGDDVLLIRRGKPPFQGRWSIPGGRVHYGETVKQAVVREVREETGVEIEIVGLLDVFDGLPATGGPAQANDGFTRHMVMIDYICRWRGGEPVAGDDATAAQFTPLAAALDKLSWDVTRQAVARAAAWMENGGAPFGGAP